ncbi:MAG: hypothetical protein ACLP9L_10545 [Thermoguttaceae bacterium]
MIINKYSVLSLFVGSLSLALAAVLAITALWSAGRIRRGHGELDASRAEQSIHLATLVAIVSLAILVIGWPLLYAMLDSFVPEIPGAMCIYGVTKVMPAASALVQAARPALILLLGAWLLLESVRRQSGLPARRSRGMIALALFAGLLAFSQGTEIYYIVKLDSLNEVSCCCSGGSSAKLQPAAYYLPWAQAGWANRAVVSTLFFAGTPLLAVWLLVQAGRGPRRSQRLACAESALLLAAAVGIASAALFAFSEVLAPLLMRLPFHHCLYCLLFNGRAPDAPLIVANMAVGSFMAGWAAVLQAALQTESPGAVAWRWHRRLCRMGAATLGATVLMVVIHLAVYRG